MVDSFLKVNDLELFYRKVPEINYLSQQYNLHIESDFFSTIKEIFPNVVEEDIVEAPTHDLNLFTVQNPDEWKLPPLTYGAMGLLGDFIHQLSVVNENFRKTGRKGIVYLTNLGTFRHGRERAFADTCDILKSQVYIEDYVIHTTEEYEIDLTKWITSPLLFCVNWNKLYYNTYGVNWGASPWLVVDQKDERWKDTTFIHVSKNRPIDPRTLIENIDDCVFISEDEEEYNNFANNIQAIEYFKPSSFSEMVIAINSCKLFVGSLSAPLAIAYASFTNCMSKDLNTIDSVHFRNMNELWTFFQYC